MGLGRRVLLATVGLASLAVYLAAAVVGYELLIALWTQRPSPEVAAGIVVLTALAVGGLSYLTGVRRLRRSLDAVPLPRRRSPEVYRRLDRLVERMDVAPPELLVARLPVPNAFAVGGRRGAIVVDRRLLGLLSADELEALLAHELAHLETHDALVQTLAYSLVRSLVGLVGLAVFPVVILLGGVARAVALLRGRPASWPGSWLGRTQRRGLQLVGLLGFAVTLVLLAYSRRREWRADERAAAVTGNPMALARALRTIERVATPDLGPLTPLYVHGDDDNALSRLLSTHPSMYDRVERLRAMATGRRASP